MVGIRTRFTETKRRLFFRLTLVRGMHKSKLYEDPAAVAKYNLFPDKQVVAVRKLFTSQISKTFTR